MISHLTSWCTASGTLDLGTNEVHVWRACLDLTAYQVQRLEDNLVAEERRRAERYHFQKDRECFIAARVRLRTILCRYLETEPTQLRFCYGPYGKPELAGKMGGKSIRFNVSHSHKIALYAVTRYGEIGIDVEYIRPDLTGEEIAKIAE
ncbi:MAG TPA: 4'-phosphopantetheinyl transferase family protein, partial [Candidatus Avalokitesvara rifleensis]|uniref:4'-phosphopantetheinyl transferase family protein n=1 Tax=Candidatus Avalokitesvara rifleensis TaxID=3367620 RepID=UPI004025FC6F